MKINYYVVLLVIGCCAAAFFFMPRFLKNEDCRCYCSDVCGPRDLKPDDTPYYQDGVCFCKKRDERNYKKNGCHLKPKQNFKNCCDEEKNCCGAR